MPEVYMSRREKLAFLKTVADKSINDVSKSRGNWREFLQFYAKFYKYSFSEALLIHAQAPDATACGELRHWNTVGRRVHRGTKGIPVFDETDRSQSIRYVFDVADTYGEERGIPRRWTLPERYKEAVLQELQSRFSAPSPADKYDKNFKWAVEEYCRENCLDHLEGIQYDVDGSFLERLDIDNIRKEFIDTVVDSVGYLICERLEIEQGLYDNDELAFEFLHDFNTKATMSRLGTAVNHISRNVLTIVNETIRREATKERIGENDRGTEIRGSVESVADTRGGNRGTGNEPTGGRTSPDREIRDVGAELSQGTPPGTVHIPGARSADRRDMPESGRGIQRDDGNDTSAVTGADATAAEGRFYGDGTVQDNAPRPSGGNSDERNSIQEAVTTEVDGESSPLSAFSGDTPTVSDIYDKYAPIVANMVTLDEAYQNACRNSDEQNSETECRSAVRRAVMNFGMSEPDLLRIYSDMPEFKTRLWNYVFENTYTELSQAEEENSPLSSFSEDKFYVDAENQKVTWVYYNPDSNAGGQYVYNEFDYALIKEAAKVDDFFDYIGSACRQYLIDIDSEGFEESDRDFKNLPYAFADCGDDTKNALIALATEHENRLKIGMELNIDGRKFSIDRIDTEYGKVSLRDTTFQNGVGFPIFRSESIDFVLMHMGEQEQTTSTQSQSIQQSLFDSKNTIVKEDIDLWEENSRSDEAPESVQDTITTTTQTAEQQRTISQTTGLTPAASNQENNAQNFRLKSDFEFGLGGPKAKYLHNVEAIKTLKTLEDESRNATPDEQSILAEYTGWGGIPYAFDERNESWQKEYAELKELLSEKEYETARNSTLNAHYTGGGVIEGIYKGLDRIGFKGGNMLEPALGTGNFYGMLPEQLAERTRLYGVELDSITGRIAKQLYPNANIQIQGFETSNLPDNFFDAAVGNVPFGNYRLNDPKYDKYNLLIHDYFFCKSLDKVRPGGVIAYITSKGTMDKENASVRRYIAERAELLGAIRLPNNAFQKIAATEVTTDILFLKKRDRLIDATDENWVNTGLTPDGLMLNEYYIDNPQMMLGEFTEKTGPFGMETTLESDGRNLAEGLSDAIEYLPKNSMELRDIEFDLDSSDREIIPADPSVKNFCHIVYDGEVYQRVDSEMLRKEYPKVATERVAAMIEMRELTRHILNIRLEGCTDEDLQRFQGELNNRYDSFYKKFGPSIQNTINGFSAATRIFLCYPLLRNWTRTKT